MAGYKAFQSRMIGSDLLEEQAFTDFNSRKLRYAIMWAMYENNAYSKMQVWAESYKAEYALYKAIRNVYNPSYRLGEFWKVHLLGGQLDPEAGDGKTVPSALPIETENDALRAPLAQLWKWSNWQVRKDILGLWTPVMGDGIIKIFDDPEKQRVYMKPMHPGTLKDVTLDEWGNVKGYLIEERRPDPRQKRTLNDVRVNYVTYREFATRDGEDVVYKTYLDDQLYAWDGNRDENGNPIAEWTENYGFIPMVVFQHNNVGLPFGWSELQPGLSKFREVDDLASKLTDYVRKSVDAPWLLVNVSNSGVDLKTSSKDANKNDKNNQIRQELKAIYGGVGADAKPLIANMSIADTTAYIQDVLENIEHDYPELRVDIANATGDISGRALRINRGPAEDRVLQRRPNYDDAIARAQMMALSIGGMRGYKGFEGINDKSFDEGKLEHTIGKRPVFSKDPQDDVEFDTAFFAAANAAKTFGVPPLIYLKTKGWSDEQIAEIEQSMEHQARMATLDATILAAKNPPTSTPATNRFGKQASQNDPNSAKQ